MPLDRLVLIAGCVIGGFAVTLWLGTLVLAAVSVPYAWLALIPAGFAAYVIYRVIAERVQSADDDHYDRMEH